MEVGGTLLKREGEQRLHVEAEAGNGAGRLARDTGSTRGHALGSERELLGVGGVGAGRLVVDLAPFVELED